MMIKQKRHIILFFDNEPAHYRRHLVKRIFATDTFAMLDDDITITALEAVYWIACISLALSLTLQAVDESTLTTIN